MSSTHSIEVRPAKNPLRIRIDLEHGYQLVYISYVDADTAKVARSLDVWHHGQVAADFDEAGNVFGIELLSLDAETIEHARRFAAKHALAFPSNLAGVLVAPS